MAYLVSQLITDAFVDLGVITVNETITAAMQADGFIRLNQLIDSLSAEGATVYTELLATLTASSGVTAYTFGVGGSWATTLRPQKIVSWKMTSGLYTSGGPPVSLAEFGAAAQLASQTFGKVNAQITGLEADMAAKIAALQAALVAEATALTVPFYLAPAFFFTGQNFPALALTQAAVPLVLGADTAWPLINVRVFPAPAQTASAEITYWTPQPQFVAVGDTVSLPPGFQDLLRSNLAARLYAQYPRPSNLALVMGMAKETKDAIVRQNGASGFPPPPPAQQ